MENETFYIATFNSSHSAIEGERILQNFISCRLIPIPTELSAGCGMVLKTLDYNDFLNKDISFSKIFKVEKEGFNKKIVEIEI